MNFPKLNKYVFELHVFILTYGHRYKRNFRVNSSSVTRKIYFKEILILVDGEKLKENI